MEHGGGAPFEGVVSVRSSVHPISLRLIRQLGEIPVRRAQAATHIVSPFKVSRLLLRRFWACSTAVAHRTFPGS